MQPLLSHKDCVSSRGIYRAEKVKKRNIFVELCFHSLLRCFIDYKAKSTLDALWLQPLSDEMVSDQQISTLF